MNSSWAFFKAFAELKYKYTLESKQSIAPIWCSISSNSKVGVLNSIASLAPNWESEVAVSAWWSKMLVWKDGMGRLRTIEIIQMMIIAEATFYVSTAEFIASLGCSQFALGDHPIPQK